jgi:hypothetical protein
MCIEAALVPEQSVAYVSMANNVDAVQVRGWCTIEDEAT